TFQCLEHSRTVGRRLCRQERFQVFRLIQGGQFPVVFHTHIGGGFAGGQEQRQFLGCFCMGGGGRNSNRIREEVAGVLVNHRLNLNVPGEFGAVQGGEHPCAGHPHTELAIG